MFAHKYVFMPSKLKRKVSTTYKVCMYLLLSAEIYEFWDWKKEYKIEINLKKKLLKTQRIGNK